MQRLANPLLPWNPERFLADGQLNPKHTQSLAVNLYRTLDVSGVNVTVFNGQALDGSERQWPPGEARKTGSGSLLSPKVYSNSRATQTFASVQRGRVNDPTRAVGDFMALQDRVISGIAVPGRFMKDPHDPALVGPVRENLWSPEPIDRDAFWKNRGGPKGFGLEEPRSGLAFDAVPDCTLGFLNENFRKANDPDQVSKRIIPENPFPWITWNNRPYVSAGELLQVPKCSTAELPRAFAMFRSTVRQEVYEGKTEKVLDSNGEEFELDGVFPHLPNFFRTKAGLGSDGTPNTVDDEGIVGLYRVLDYVGVPSRYVGTETWLNPAAFGDYSDDDGNPSTPPVLDQVINTSDPRYLRQPPFNKVSAYRDPGRVNLNTIGAGGTGAVWHGMFHGRTNRYGVDNNNTIGNRSDDVLTHPAIDDDGFYSVRRGYGRLGDDVALLDSAYPTLFANPFRSAGTGELVPIPRMVRADVETTLLRSMGVPNAPPSPRRFFDNLSPVPQGQPLGVPLMSADPNDPQDPDAVPLEFRDPLRNAYFRYDPLKRLSSMTTTRSNVYAVWITVGYFEVSGGGQQLMQELGSDSGDVQRHRAFYVFDRSIPVGFQRGQDLNVEKAILTRRFIE